MTQTFLACGWKNYEFTIRNPIKFNALKTVNTPKKVLDDEAISYYIETGLKHKIPICCVLFFAITYEPFLMKYLNYNFGFDDEGNSGTINCPECLDAKLKDLEAIKN